MEVLIWKEIINDSGILFLENERYDDRIQTCRKYSIRCLKNEFRLSAFVNFNNNDVCFYLNHYKNKEDALNRVEELEREFCK